MPFDEIDIKILNILQDEGRITNTKLAKEIGISPPSMLDRVKRLENTGVIDKYVALVDMEKTGFGLIALIMVSLSLHQISSLEAVKDSLVKIDEVLECYQVSGDVDFLLKVATKDMNSYKDFVNNKLSGIEGIQTIKTSFVLDTLKSTTKLQVK